MAKSRVDSCASAERCRDVGTASEEEKEAREAAVRVVAHCATAPAPHSLPAFGRARGGGQAVARRVEVAKARRERRRAVVRANSLSTRVNGQRRGEVEAEMETAEVERRRRRRSTQALTLAAGMTMAARRVLASAVAWTASSRTHVQWREVR